MDEAYSGVWNEAVRAEELSMLVRTEDFEAVRAGFEVVRGYFEHLEDSMALPSEKENEKMNE